MQTKFLQRVILVSLLPILLFVFVQSASAASLIVNTANDNTIAGDGFCTLREAINNANTDSDTTSGDCTIGSGADSISFAGTYVITLGGSQLPAVTSPITINANGATIIQAAAVINTANYRVFEVGASGNLSLDGLTVRYGRCNGSCASATLSGGGIYSQGILIITDSLVTGNYAGQGAGIYNTGTLAVTNTTFSNNSAFPDGGGIRNTGTLTLINSTISNNFANTNGGGINNSGTLNYTNTIIANATSGGDCYNTGTIGTNTNNLVEDGTCSAGLSGDPTLGALGDNGGPTLTHALLHGSTAINAGNNAACPSVDQRGVPRPQGGTCDIGAYESNAQAAPAFVVNIADDTNDGTCDEFISGISDCTLREAVQIANTISGADTISFAGSYVITLAGSQLPTVTSAITINGPTIIQAASTINTAIYRVFEVNASGTLTLDGITLRYGRCNGSCVTTNNYGGGILNNGTLTLTDSLIYGNTAGFGGGVANNSILSVTNSTFSNNTATTAGGGIRNAGTLTISSSTFADNSTPTNGAGIFSGGTLNYFNTILANSTSGTDCFNSGGTIGTNTNNLAETGNCAASLSSDPVLGSLTDNGGPTSTYALLSGSLAINAGSNVGCPAADQRGVPRPYGAACDVGAFESNVQAAPAFLVNTSDDSNDGFCDTFVSGATDCTLREAIIAANTASGTDTISFAGSYVITLAGSQLPTVTTAMIINGNGATTVQAAAAANTATNRVFEISVAGSLTLDGLTIRYGRCNGACATSPSDGGGILNGGTLTLTDSLIYANTAANGGGIENIGTLSATNDTFSANTATSAGGGVRNTGTLTLSNSTFSNNSAASSSGGGINNSGTLNYRNTLVANAIAGGDCVNSGTIGTNTNNLVEDASCSASLSGDPLLGTLADHSGPTLTHALLPGSTAINAGNNAVCPAADQRGVARPQATTCDIGAFESRGFTLTVTGGNNQSTPINTAFASPLALTVTSANGEPVNGGRVTLNAPLSGASTTVTSFSVTISGGSASQSVTANAIAGGPYNVTASTAGAASNVQFALTNTEPNLTISKNVTPTSAIPGATVTYVVSFSNAGNGIATSVVITESIPAQIQVSGVSSSGVAITNTMQVPAYVWQVENLSPGESGVITFTGQIVTGLSTGTVINNTVEIAGAVVETISSNNADTASLTILNAPPVLNLISNQAVNELALLSLTATASDANGDPITFSLDAGAPTGAAITTGGAFTWTPTESQGPGSYNITVRVTDDGSPALSDSQLFTVTVSEVNQAPVLTTINNQTINEGSLLSFTATATDGDLPANTLTFTLDTGAPSGAAITTGGAFTWTPSEAQGPGIYTITVRVTDNGSPSMDDSQSFDVTVNEANQAPVLAAIGDQSVNEETLLSFTATATDNDLPADTLTFSLDAGVPSGAAITAGGAFTWTPTETQGPGVYTVTVRVTDDGTPNLDDSETIEITVNEVNQAPVLDAIGNQGVDEGSLLSFTATASDDDLPANTLTFSLDAGAPGGAAITAGGAFTWTPTEAQGPGIYNVTVRVTDNGSPNLSDSETIQITVDEINQAPVLNPISDYTAESGELLAFTATASDADLPANTLTFSLDAGAPAGASITSDGDFTWTPTELQEFNTYTITVRVVDDGSPALEDSQSFAVHVIPAIIDPIVEAGADQTANEGTSVSFSGSFSYPPVLNLPLAGEEIVWNFGDGEIITGTLTPSHVFADNGLYTVTLTVTDTLGGVGSDWLLVTVENVAPTLDAIADVTQTQGDPLALASQFSDPGVMDTHEVVIAWGDTQTTTLNLAAGVTDYNAEHTYGTAGEYTVTVTVTDQDGGTDSTTFTVTVNPLVVTHRLYLPAIMR